MLRSTSAKHSAVENMLNGPRPDRTGQVTRRRSPMPSTYASLVGTRRITLSRLALIEHVGHGPWQVQEEMALVESE